MKSEPRNPSSERDPKSEFRYPKGRVDDLVGNQLSAVTSGAGWAEFPVNTSDSEQMQLQDGTGVHPVDLIERTARFGEAIIALCKRASRNPVNDRLINQLVGCGTSIGANYCEADDAVSGKEFKLRIGTARKESKECMFFLRMFATAVPDLAEDARKLWREAKELNLIFGAIWRK